MRGVVAAHRADSLRHRNHGKRDTAALVTGVREVENAVAVGICLVMQMSVRAHEHPGRSCLGREHRGNDKGDYKQADNNVLHEFGFSSELSLKSSFGRVRLPCEKLDQVAGFSP